MTCFWFAFAFVWNYTWLERFAVANQNRYASFLTNQDQSETIRPLAKAGFPALDIGCTAWLRLPIGWLIVLYSLRFNWSDATTSYDINQSEFKAATCNRCKPRETWRLSTGDWLRIGEYCYQLKRKKKEAVTKIRNEHTCDVSKSIGSLPSTMTLYLLAAGAPNDRIL